MSDRARFLETRIKDRLVDTKKHVDTLVYALAQFGDERDATAFVEAWRSNAHERRVFAYAVQSGYENAINGAIKIAQELCELEGWTPPNQEPTSTEALKALQERGLIRTRTHTQLKDAYGQRGRLQHDYAGTLANDIHTAALMTIESVPELIQDVALFMQQRAG